MAARLDARDDPASVAKDARHRVYGVPMDLCHLADAGDALGRFQLLGPVDGISPLQRDAGRLYAEIVRTFQAVILARRVRSGSELDRAGGHDGSDGTDPEYVARYDRAVGRYRRARHALSFCGDRLAQLVVDGVVLDDRPMWGHLGTLRYALNALAHEFRDELVKAA